MKQENKDPVFPVVIFPDSIRKIIDTTHEESCFPVNYIAASLFFAASVAVGNYRTLEVNTFKAKAHLFMALLGSPGSGKTTGSRCRAGRRPAPAAAGPGPK